MNTVTRVDRTGDRLTFFKGLGLAIALFFVVCVVGIIGYIVVEGRSFMAAFYMTMITASTVMALVVEGGLHSHFAERRFNRMLEALSEHFIICGYGRIARAGADRSPYHLGGIQMAATALRPAVVDFMRLATTSERLDLAAEQIEIGPQAPLVGKSLRDANLRQAFGVIVVAIKRSSGQMQFNPSLEAGDQLVVLGDASQLKALDEAARGTGARVTRR